MSSNPEYPSSPFKLRLAARCVALGGILAYPTEAVYGLGCDPWNGEAVRRLLAVKRRAEHKGLILIAAEFAQLAPFLAPLDTVRMKAVLATWPGPVTWLLPARAQTPRWLTGRHETLAVRVTPHPLAAALCDAVGGALVSTSANLSDRPAARTAFKVRKALGKEVDYILVGTCGGRASPSTILDGRTGAVIRA
ncbi:MAG: L-threonylcarbamoyladenylate synthase [Pseudomonadota bacterium]|nr:L-threonylcarbamoyladenylate synthase [Pseudomonadota bacterium]